VVDSAGQYLLTYPVNTDGSVTAKDLDSAVPLQLPVTSGDPQATSNIKLGVNVNAGSEVVTDQAQFQDGYAFDPNNPETFTNSTSITIFDDLGNPTIATVYFIKTQAASADDPTNKYDTRLVINDTIINPDLVSAVDDAGKQIYIDRFGQQTTTIPDDNYFIEGKGSPLYKLDDLKSLIPSQPAKISGEGTLFDFGEEGDKLVEIVTDPLQFKSTREAGVASDVYWGKDFLLVNVDDSDQPVSIDINPGFYNADQLAAEVERAINAAYGDDRKFQVEQNIDDTLTIDFQRVGADGSITALENKISVSLTGTETYITELMKEKDNDFSITGTSPDFTKEEFLAHAQVRINEALNENPGELGVSELQFSKTRGAKIDDIYEGTAVARIKRENEADPSNPDYHYLVHSFYNSRPALNVYTNMEQASSVSATTDAGVTEQRRIYYDANENKLTVYLPTGTDMTQFGDQRSVMLAGNDKFRSELNGREFQISRIVDTGANAPYIELKTSGLALADDNFSVLTTNDAGEAIDVFVLTSPANDEPTIEAFFEGTHPVYDGAKEIYPSQRVILREIQGSSANTALGGFVADAWMITNTDDQTANVTSSSSMTITGALAQALDTFAVTLTDEDGNATTFTHTATGADDETAIATGLVTASSGSAYTLTNVAGVISITRSDGKDFSIGTGATSAGTAASTAVAMSTNGESSLDNNLKKLGLNQIDHSTQTSVDWVDEKNPPVKIGYDAINQRLKFEVDRTVLGSGTQSDFNSFSIYGSTTQTDTNNLGLTTSDNAQRVQIRGGEVLYGESFFATGEEIQPNDKRYGIEVSYNSELQNFSIQSGTTGENIDADGAIGVQEQQKSSNIQVGRHVISQDDGSRVVQNYNVDATIIGNGDNLLFGVGSTKNDFLFEAGRGLKSQPAQAIGASANEPLSNVFKLSSQNGDNIFNVSVNGISGIIEVPATSYVGTTLAEALQTRINQIVDPETGETIGGVTVTYSSDTNSFTFTTGTTGSDSTIKVKGAARLGLDDVPLGVGSVPEIYNLVQATDTDGVALYVDANGEVVTNPPANMVEGYYPLYIDEGELTFDKTGKLISPKNLVRYEKQEEGFSISLDVDYSTSTQLAQPFSVLTVEQDGFTSGRLDGIEIDSSGTIRANYTNGQNNPLGKIVVANFNNQNGLKQIGNATYTETAVSGTPQVGEAGSEGFGNILSGSLERSNVDITEELVNLITAQRNFQASAKAIETTTGLTQTIINIRM